MVFSAAGQTGRIALGSHAGRVAEASDNFGIVPMPGAEWRADTLVYLNDSLAIHSGQMRSWAYSSQREKAVWHRQTEQEEYNSYGNLSSQASLTVLRNRYPHAVFVGFDKLGKHSKKKASKGAQTFSKRPFQYSYWRGLATVAALGAVGWLLSRKPEANRR